MKIKILSLKKPANALVAALQVYCEILVSEPEKYGISDLYALEERIWEYAEQIKADHPRCKLSHLKSEVHRYNPDDMLGIMESYDLIHRRDNILFSISIHRMSTNETKNQL